ncbi:MAG TPA: hypothetical protein VMI56_19050 [Reyranella sp.]|nr:hypothetical protein [Reyranella sp.]
MKLSWRVLPWIVAALATGMAAALALGVLPALRPNTSEPAGASSATVGEKLAVLRGDRAGLQARADGEARIELLQPFRVASLLGDALAARLSGNTADTLDRLPAAQRRAFADLDSLNATLRDGIARPGEGSRAMALAAATRAQASLEALAGLDEQPLVLSFTPRFVPPRRATGELTLEPRAPPATAPKADSFKLETGPARRSPGDSPTVPRYAPSFVTAGPDDPAVTVEVVGLHLGAPADPPPTLTVGAWRGEAALSPARLRFSVPRRAFPTDVARTTLLNATLSLHGAGRGTTFDLLLLVLPDRPGSFALDQKIRTTATEADTLVSPEILSRGGVGETKSLRRCFDPPPGWRFDKSKRRVVIVERLAWQDDVGDSTLNSGTVEFAPDEKPNQVCIVVTAKPVTKTARAATIGRFEITLVRDRAEDRVVQTGIRALDWQEAVTMPVDPGAVEWKLYVRLFDEIDREVSRTTQDKTPLPAIPFVRLERSDDGRMITLRGDQEAKP